MTIRSIVTFRSMMTFSILTFKMMTICITTFRIKTYVMMLRVVIL
jgi:hypothetical protein